MSTKPWVGKGVVIIDDSANVRADLQLAFTAAGLTVLAQAENGVRGLELAQQFKPDVISIDLIMPEMDGVECYRRIMEWQPNQRCVIISWLANEPKIVENLKSIIPTHLFQSKPVTAKDLEARLTKIYFPERFATSTPERGLEDSTQELLKGLEIKVS